MQKRLRRLAPLLIVLCGCHSAPTTAGSPAADDPLLGGIDEASFMAMHELDTTDPGEANGTDVTVEVPGLGPMACYLALPPEHDGSSLPGVIVIHEWWGPNAHIRLWTDRLAAEGYAALAADLYDGTVATTREGAMAAMRSVNGDEARRRLQAAHRWLSDAHCDGGARPTASIGWCFGGGWSLAMAMEVEELDGAVVYYGRTDIDPERAARTSTRVLGIYAERDGWIGPDYVRALGLELETAGVDFQWAIYPADHAFANPSSAVYDHEQAALAWERSSAFLADVLTGR